jgi:hypothetical protein
MADLSSLLGAAGVGGVIGKAIVQLELSTAQYQTELKGAQATTAASTNAMGASTSKFSSLASTALLGVGAAAVAGAALSVKAAIEANEAHIKLQNTFANNASLADSSVEAFEAQADSLRDLTGVDDEAIISGQALLGQFKLTGAQVLELTPLIVDLSAKMGIDLEAAAKAVGKATEGNTGSLARYIGKIEEGKTPLETFTNITDKLGRVQGFAAERADAEPWRVLTATFEEVAEQIGQGLLPVVQSLSDAFITLAPAIGFVAKGLEFLPLVQAGEDLRQVTERTDEGGAGWKDYADIVVDTIPVLGHFVDISGEVEESFISQRGLIGDLSDFYRSKYIEAVGAAGEETKNFAHMTIKEFNEWSQKTKEALKEATFALENLGDASETTGKDFVKSQREMLQDARTLSRAMREISGEKWVNDEYLQFLVDQGPGAITGFADLNERQQKRMQENWLETSRGFDSSIGRSFKDLDNALDHLDKKTTSHVVRIKYEYEGFDPTKPGMASPAHPAP